MAEEDVIVRKEGLSVEACLEVFFDPPGSAQIDEKTRQFLF